MYVCSAIESVLMQILNAEFVDSCKVLGIILYIMIWMSGNKHSVGYLEGHWAMGPSLMPFLVGLPKMCKIL